LREAYKATCVTTDAHNNVLITGSYQGINILFGSYTLTNGYDGTNLFMTKYDNDGNLIFAKGADCCGADIGKSITTDQIGNIYLTGYFGPEYMSFGVDTLLNNGVNTQDIYIIKFDSTGGIVWQNSSRGFGNNEPNSITTDIFGNIYMSGYFTSTYLSFNSDTIFNSTGNSDDVFLAKLDVTLSIKSIINKNNEILIIPNPSSETITIKVNSKNNYNSLYINDLSGRIVYYYNGYFAGNQLFTIILPNLPNGVYELSLAGTKTEEKTVFVLQK